MSYHRHKCKFCGFVWEHHNMNDVSHNAVMGSHECPSCHRCNWGLGIYSGDEEPRVRNGAEPTDPTLTFTIHSDQIQAFS